MWWNLSEVQVDPIFDYVEFEVCNRRKIIDEMNLGVRVFRKMSFSMWERKFVLFWRGRKSAPRGRIVEEAATSVRSVTILLSFYR
jgi:hypothetical protein